MANRRLYQDGASFHPKEQTVNLQFTAGVSGAVPAFTVAGWRRSGIASVVLTATGIYTVTFQDTYVGLIKATVDILQETYSVTAAGKVVIKPSEVLVSTSKTIALRCYTTNGVATAAALTAGDILQARFVMSGQQGNG